MRRLLPLSIALFGLRFAGSAMAANPHEQIIYQFHGGSDGAGPSAGMIADQAGNLYGVTGLGGGSAHCAGGCGTVFELSPPAADAAHWTETVLYRFEGGSDGANPQAPLAMDGAGGLYGTTGSGGDGNCTVIGSAGCGIVFELVRPSSAAAGWKESILYSFQGVPGGRGSGDLATPNGLAFDKSGNLLGLAYSGGYCLTDETGTYCYGGAYELRKPSAAGTAWTEKVIYIFPGPTGAPAGPIFASDGDLYGTVAWGKYGFGEVFKLIPPAPGATGWREVSVFDFNGSDGAFPEPGLAFDKSANLFGATLGSPGYGSPYGDVYELTPESGGASSESLIYDFTPYQNGNTPNGGIIVGAGGQVYGTAAQGGQGGYGVIYALTPSSPPGGDWSYQMLYGFTGGAGGSPSYGPALGLAGALYGTTSTGGDMSCGGGAGCGTVFEVVR